MLTIQTTAGPVQGFADTYPLRDRSAASEVEEGGNGGKEPVWKWLVSLAWGWCWGWGGGATRAKGRGWDCRW